MRKRKVLFLGRPYSMAACICLLLTMLTSIVSATWQLVIDGPTEVQAGELVILTARQVHTDLFCDVKGDCSLPSVMQDNITLKPSAKTQLVWQMLPDDPTASRYRICDDGRTLVFASREVGCYHFVLAAGDGETLQMVTHTLFNLGERQTPIPLPIPDPDPQPEPTPEPPCEFQSLTDWATEQTAKLVSSEFFVREKATLVESLTEITTRIRYNEIMTAERARVEMRVLTRKKLDAVSRRSTAAWLAWETELARQLTQLERDGKLETLDQVRQAFDAIADGLLACEPVSQNGIRPKGGR